MQSARDATIRGMARQPTNSHELVTALLEGQQELGDDLFALLYDRLRAVAASMMQRERGNHTLQPTALVHEAWMNLIDQDLIGDMPVDEARCRFVGLAAHAMRRVLIDHARSGNWSGASTSRSRMRMLRCWCVAFVIVCAASCGRWGSGQRMRMQAMQM